ncbi:hypothetical protein [Natrinema salsiterrestre]|uniref:Right-handed parallel beta-helix repeat-containing protein n=1 Tax=Natrinema salsiterrestre TaxID=2950540 RepID=A0A9Q4Q0I3_9EURY|nr:hypothetical protein [Natrinema salsiterrestre]MDF9745979.1 hypothetical protein [Natrinema salsiterrestre]
MIGDPESFPKKKSIDRRSYLKAAVAAVGATTLQTTASASAEDYDVIEVGSGETFSKRLSDGETWKNVLIDISAEGAAYSIIAVADNWEIKNIGVLGTFDSHTNGSAFNVEVPSADATGLIQNVYLPGAYEPGHDYNGPMGIYVTRNHGGDLLIQNVNVQNMQDNGIYASSTGHEGSDGADGSVRIEDSYFHGNATCHTRIGTSSSYVKNCVGWNGIHRGHWQYYEHSDMIDCDYGENGTDIILGGSSYPKQDTAELSVKNSRYDTVSNAGSGINGSSAGTPRHRSPSDIGAPASAEEAASGQSGDSTDDNNIDPFIPAGDFSLEVTAQNDFAEYLIELDAEAVEVGNEAEPDDEQYTDRAFESGEHWYIHGYTGGSADNFRVTGGEILRVGEIQGTSRITANGTPLDLSVFDTITSVPGDKDSQLPNVVVIDGEGTSDTASYEFVVSDTVEPSNDENATIDEAATVDGTHASGVVADYLDAWRFNSEIEQFSIDGDATVRVNGVEVDPDRFDDVGEKEEAQLPNVIVIDGNGTSDTASYEFVVSDTVEPSNDENATVDEAATVDGTYASGVVADYLDAWRFNSEIEQFSIDGDATIRVNGVKVDSDRFDDVSST